MMQMETRAAGVRYWLLELLLDLSPMQRSGTRSEIRHGGSRLRPR